MGCSHLTAQGPGYEWCTLGQAQGRLHWRNFRPARQPVTNTRLAQTDIRPNWHNWSKKNLESEPLQSTFLGPQPVSMGFINSRNNMKQYHLWIFVWCPGMVPEALADASWGEPTENTRYLDRETFGSLNIFIFYHILICFDIPNYP